MASSRESGSPSSKDNLPKRQKTSEERESMCTRKAIFKELILKEIVEGRDVKVSFHDFPYYLSDCTRDLLAVSCIHIKYGERLNYTSLPGIMNTKVLLSGPAGSEIYQETLAKALANYCDAKLLIFDRQSIMAGLFAREAELQEERNSVEKSNNTAKQNCGAFVGTMCSPAGTSKNPLFRLGDRVRFIGSSVSRSLYATSSPSRGPTSGYSGIVALPFEDIPLSKIGVKFDTPVPDHGIDFGGLYSSDQGYLYFCNANELCLESTSEEDLYKLLIPTLFEAVCSESRTSPLVLFIKDAVKSVVGNAELYATFKSRLENLSKHVIVIGSQTHMDNHKEEMHDRGKEVADATKILTELFPKKVNVLPPQDKSLLVTWKQQLDQDSETLRMKGNLNCLRAALRRYGYECDVLETLCIKEQSLTDTFAEEAVALAFIHHLMQNSEVNPNAKVMLSGDSIQYGIELLQSDQNESNSLKKSLKDVVTENEFEEKLLEEVIPPNDIGVTFADIGGLENVKERLKELVMLPLQRPELFCKDQIKKGILLFGLFGTGKKMLAKAVAAETGANFISTSMSRLISKSYGDDGVKHVKAVFTLASKIAPSVVFVDEVHTMFGRRENRGEQEDMSKMKWEWVNPGKQEAMSKMKWEWEYPGELEEMFGRRENRREQEDMSKMKWERENPGEQEDMSKMKWQWENPGELEEMCMKHEFMVSWDGLHKKDKERVLVLAATNRPFDIDEGVIKRFPHRLMVNQPDATDRAKILKLVLASAGLSADVDLGSVAKMTKGYSGRALKDLCLMAADYPLVEWKELEEELREKNKKERSAAQLAYGLPTRALSSSADIRPLNMDDFKKARKDHNVAWESRNLTKIQLWNEQYGEGGSRDNTLSYYI